ncbi:very short patch repair endonuclease [Mycobacterium sp. CBMA293]|nr:MULTISPECIES: very short patch repair endonuclease [unclassified Mycolicibacterium]MUM09040.1 very short patch repair endonuclease [Mycolicibacterium sp. CBMA 213]MUL49062.1 very short patch repair endonuclease [Mycolicibacterium sp. CBMA 360]MUL60924.1 very short patch repair endonuclease [Mycolicibacterium sp. CBMA 335]MUL71937.1 very short patch repair endonuclease [Mycolicibacterium sp. CBMA 311]MUL95865.1 very short patch repair endonuclease [Mycolicibacterium sp. CBMA 230]
MQVQRTRDTAPEMAVRRLLHSMGFRYRVDRAPLSGLRRRADIVFGQVKVAVFIDGCFWHGCPEHGRRQTQANSAYWSTKIARNRNRDKDTDARLTAAGWTVVRAWEHTPAADTAELIARTVRAARESRSQPRGSS